jgi:hypothetical protein
MKRWLSTMCVTLTLLETVFLLPACRYRPGSKFRQTRWGIVVIFGKDGACKHLSGPHRIGAYPTDDVVWLIHNKCGTSSHTFAISDIRRAPNGYKASSPAPSREEAARRQLERQKHEEVNPFEGDLSTTTDKLILSLRVKEDAAPGLYTFVTLLDGKPDDDDEIDIWPPR